MTLRIQQFLPALVLLVFLAGCASSPPARIFVLGDPPSPVIGLSTQSDRPVTRLLPVSAPDYLDTEDILLRSGQNEVAASPTGRWAERLSAGVTHALAAALSTRLPATDIVVDEPIMPPVQQILVNIEAFEIRPDGQCLLTARWTLSSGEGQRVLRSGQGTFVGQAAETGDAAIASAMTRLIDRLADQIAAVEKEG
jgi:cholesterol transport system auxiliary component